MIFLIKEFFIKVCCIILLAFSLLTEIPFSQQMSKMLWVNQIGQQASNALPVEITDGMIVYDLKERIKVKGELTCAVRELVIMDPRNGNEELSADAMVDASFSSNAHEPRYLFKLPSAGMR